MAVDIHSTVRDVVVEIPNATRYFEQIGIDYCCGGERSLQEASQGSGRKIEEVMEALERLKQAKPGDPTVDWQDARMAKLISHILEQHHRFTRDELARLSSLLTKVCGVHGMNHAELAEIREVFTPLSAELLDHMQKEEQVLFPHLIGMEDAVERRQPIPSPFFLTVLNPIEILMADHESAGEALQAIRRLSSDFTVPADGCGSFRALYQGLKEIEQDLHQHIHLENNILFPRAARMENDVTCK